MLNLTSSLFTSERIPQCRGRRSSSFPHSADDFRNAPGCTLQGVHPMPSVRRPMLGQQHSLAALSTPGNVEFPSGAGLSQRNARPLPKDKQCPHWTRRQSGIHIAKANRRCHGTRSERQTRNTTATVQPWRRETKPELFDALIYAQEGAICTPCWYVEHQGLPRTAKTDL